MDCFLFACQKHLNMFVAFILQDENGKKYKMLPNQPGYSKLSIGGTISVGAQGTGSSESHPLTQSPGDFVRSLCIVCVKNGKVVRYQIEPASAPVHDPEVWKNRFGNENYELIQDDDCFNGVIINLGTVGIVVSYCLELVDACFLLEKRYLMTWDEFKSEKKAEFESDVKDGSIVRWHVWLSPYTVNLPLSRYRKSPPVVVMTYSVTDQKPPKVLTSKIRGCFEEDYSKAIINAKAAVMASKVAKKIVPLLLKLALDLAMRNKHPLAMDPFGAVATTSATVLVPGAAVGNGFAYDKFVDAVEAWIKYSEEQFKGGFETAIPGIMSVR